MRRLDMTERAQASAFEHTHSADDLAKVRPANTPLQRRTIHGGGMPAIGGSLLGPPTARAVQMFADAVGAGLYAGRVQLDGTGGGLTNDAVHRAAAHGLSGNGGSLPHLGAIQKAFGRHDVSGVQAHVGGKAAEGSAAMGARAYAAGNQVAFSASPDLHLAAHEAAHVVQQRGGVQLSGGVGAAGDTYEQHADAVADLVTRGQSAEALLDQHAPSSGESGGIQRAVQRQETEHHHARGAHAPAPEHEPEEAAAEAPAEHEADPAIAYDAMVASVSGLAGSRNSPMPDDLLQAMHDSLAAVVTPEARECEQIRLPVAFSETLMGTRYRWTGSATVRKINGRPLSPPRSGVGTATTARESTLTPMSGAAHTDGSTTAGTVGATIPLGEGRPNLTVGATETRTSSEARSSSVTAGSRRSHSLATPRPFVEQGMLYDVVVDWRIHVELDTSADLTTALLGMISSEPPGNSTATAMLIGTVRQVDQDDTVAAPAPAHHRHRAPAPAPAPDPRPHRIVSGS